MQGGRGSSLVFDCSILHKSVHIHQITFWPGAASYRMAESTRRTVFVTVGTTKFEDLIRWGMSSARRRCWRGQCRAGKRTCTVPPVPHHWSPCSCMMHARRAVDTREFADALAAKGFTDLIIQKGAGAYEPQQLLRGVSGRSATLANGLRIE